MNGNINWPQTEREENFTVKFHNMSPRMRGVSGPFHVVKTFALHLLREKEISSAADVFDHLSQHQS